MASMPCPDPSAHRDARQHEQASAAALLATSPSRRKIPAEQILDRDSKLSARGAAMSLKHARPEDLPSYPSTGGVYSHHTTGAANLANSSQKPFEHWKPDPSSAAGKAALLAKDYKPAPMWQPGLSEAGSKAALLAAKDGGRVDIWSPEANTNGSTAAAQAFKSSFSPKIAQSPSADSHNKALLAATRSVGRARAGSTPIPVAPSYPDSHKSAHNALNAATVAHRPKKFRDDDVMSSPALEESRIKYLSDKISRDMFTEHPPVSIEVEEKRHQDALRASAVSMAKGMYDLAQKRAAEPGPSSDAAAASTVAGRNAAVAQPDVKQQAMQYIHLQEAARKLAEERLAKMDPDGAARFREHYGYPNNPPRRRLSMRDKYLRRANSDSNLSDSDDEAVTRRIRHQMTQFNKDLDAVDEKKRQTDRAALLAAAERKVQAQMHSMDEKVFAETGKVSPAMMEQWEAKAREKAAKNSEKRTENYGKQDIGGGKFMDMKEIEAIAAARLQPTLDEINDNAEKRRARDEELRVEAEDRKVKEVKTKQNDKEAKAAEKEAKHQEKLAAKQKEAEEKDAVRYEREQKKLAAKAEKEAEKARKEEQKRVSKRRSADAKRVAVGSAAAAAVIATEDDKDKPQTQADTNAEDTTHEGDLWNPAAKNLGPEKKASEDATLRPALERHVTEIASSSESEVSDGDDDSDDNDVFIDAEQAAEPERGRSRNVAGTERLEAFKVDNEQANAIPSIEEHDKHIGTDGEIGQSDVISTATGIVLISDIENASTNDGAEKPTATPAPVPIAQSKDTSAHDASASSPRSPHRLSKFLGRLRRPSKPAAPDDKHVLTKDRKASGAAPSEPPAKPRTTTSSDDGPVALKPSTSAGSPSSFVRHAARDDGASSASSLSSDEPDTPAFRGLVPPNTTAADDEEEAQVGTAQKAVPKSGARLRKVNAGGAAAEEKEVKTKFQEIL